MGFRFNRYHQPTTNWDQVPHSPKITHTFPPFLVHLPTHCIHLATGFPRTNPLHILKERLDTSLRVHCCSFHNDSKQMMGLVKVLCDVRWRHFRVVYKAKVCHDHLVSRDIMLADILWLDGCQAGDIHQKKMKGLIMNSFLFIGSPLKNKSK